MTDLGKQSWGVAPALGRLVALGLALRVLAADAVQWYAGRKGVVCVFPDTGYYWLLAGKIRRGEPYEVVDFGDLPRFALRTPGYPLFLAACQSAFGLRALPARLVQAALGALCVWLVARLVTRTLGEGPAPTPAGARGVRRWTPALVAAAIAAVDPYTVANSAFLLSEALFLPLMLAAQLGLAACWGSENSPGTAGLWWRALLTGAASGAAVMVRPSWSLYVPLVSICWVVLAGRASRGGALRAARGAVFLAVGAAAVMSPWWARNAAIYGRFVPTALWMGASLYDGLNPSADGDSDMRFLGSDRFWPLDEETQDAALRSEALAFARGNPGRVLTLAAVKAGRFWSPWPNAEAFRSAWLVAPALAVTLPVFALMALGAWGLRRDGRALVLLGLPLLYTFLLHLVFVSSMRYRVPVMVPALGFAGVGLWGVWGRWRDRLTNIKV